MSTAFSEMNADDCGIKDIGPVVWDDVVDLAVKKEDLPFKKENLPFVPSVKDNISYSSKSHKQKGRGHSIRDAIKKRKVKADREKLNQLEAEKLGHCPSAPPKKRKRETSHVSPENSKKQCLGPRRRQKKDATTKTVSSSSDSLPAFGPSQKDSSIHIPQDVTTYEQEVDIPTIEQAMELAKKIETDDHVEHDFDGIWEEIDDEYHTQHLPSVKVQNNVLVQNAGDGIWEEIDDEYHTQHLPSVECWE